MYLAFISAATSAALATSTQETDVVDLTQTPPENGGKPFNLAAIYLYCVSIYSVQGTLWFLNFMLVSALGNLHIGEIANLLKLNDMKHLLIRLFKGRCLDGSSMPKLKMMISKKNLPPLLNNAIIVFT